MLSNHPFFEIDSGTVDFLLTKFLIQCANCNRICINQGYIPNIVGVQGFCRYMIFSFLYDMLYSLEVITELRFKLLTSTLPGQYYYNSVRFIQYGRFIQYAAILAHYYFAIVQQLVTVTRGFCLFYMTYLIVWKLSRNYNFSRVLYNNALLLYNSKLSLEVITEWFPDIYVVHVHNNTFQQSKRIRFSVHNLVQFS